MTQKETLQQILDNQDKFSTHINKRFDDVDSEQAKTNRVLYGEKGNGFKISIGLYEFQMRDNDNWKALGPILFIMKNWKAIGGVIIALIGAAVSLSQLNII